jgi:hypothetical protein
VIDRGTCLFVVKVKNAQDAGADRRRDRQQRLARHDQHGRTPMRASRIPSVSITQADGDAIKTALRRARA